MTKIWKSDLYRFGKSRLFYGIAAVTSIIALALILTIRKNIRLGISVFGNLTAFRNADDIIRIGVQYYKGLGIFAAVLISAFIGQEYSWKTWQHKCIIVKNRAFIYLSKAMLSSAASVLLFLLFQAVVLLCSGQIKEILTGGYMAMILCASSIYAALGAVLCMLSMLIRSNIASTIVCLGYVLFCETLMSIIRIICSFTETATKIGEWIISHTIYAMSSIINGVTVSTESILPILLNSMVIILLSIAGGISLFRKYEL
ncbi:MAG: hypothetical protein FWG30_03100 [Eubacteriaceae bacterium]|nr:hypothetical protein [Eubacteriaceae bacterium]